jgi:CRP/FNR family transcriptional regulator, cyclic AMP receptor protein
MDSQEMAIKPTTRAEGNGLEAIADRDFLGRLTPDLIAELMQFGHEARYPAGTLLVAPGGGGGPAILVSGALRYFLIAPDGRQVTIRYIGPGGLVGTVVREESNNRSSVEVLTPSVLLHLDAEQVWTLSARRPEMAQALLNDAVSRMRAAYRALAARAFTTVRARVARDIVDRATIAGPLCSGMRLEVTHQALADAIGSVREVVARALGQLRREGVITSSRDGITILDPLALRRAAGDVT